jgi:hypothetical protein
MNAVLSLDLSRTNENSAITANKQSMLNMNFANTRAMQDNMLHILLQTHQAVMNRAAHPIPSSRAMFQENLEISQYRHNDIQPYVNDPHTFLFYPVFENFDTKNRQVVGVLATNLYWRRFFADILPAQQAGTNGYICVLQNSFHQTLRYRVDGPNATYLGAASEEEENGHDDDERLVDDDLGLFADINEFVQDRASPQSQSYTTVPLNKEFGQYRLHIYPSLETKHEFSSNKPWVYATCVLVVMLLTTIVLILLDRFVAQRQRIFYDRLVCAAEANAAFEHDLNAFLAHEVRK